MATKKAPPSEGKRHPLNLRTTRELREKIDQMAGISGRSLVQEVEHRLEQSFNRDVMVNMLLGGDDNAKVLEMIAQALQAEDLSGRKWRDSKKSAEAVRATIDFIFAGLAGLPERSPKTAVDLKTAKTILDRRGVPYPPEEE
jgi:hypothetical protein